MAEEILQDLDLGNLGRGDDEEILDILNQFRQEFNRLNRIQVWARMMKLKLEKVEGESRYLHLFVQPLIAFYIFVTPLLIAIVTGYPISLLHQGFARKFSSFLAIFAVLSLVLSLPSFVMLWWAMKDEQFRSKNCRCLHHCHRHLFCTQEREPIFNSKDDENDGPIRRYVKTVRDSILAGMLFLANLMGVNLYACDICNASNLTETRGCHCFNTSETYDLWVRLLGNQGVMNFVQSNSSNLSGMETGSSEPLPILSDDSNDSEHRGSQQEDGPESSLDSESSSQDELIPIAALPM